MRLDWFHSQNCIEVRSFVFLSLNAVPCSLCYSPLTEPTRPVTRLKGFHLEQSLYTIDQQSLGNITMSETSWCDITTEDAQGLVKFYEAVMGWRKEPIDMGGYNDFVMMKPDGIPVGGICHKRGVNEGLPGGWIQYFTVQNLDDSLANVKKLGGGLVGDIRHHGKDSFCVIQDPSGAFCALYEKGSD